MGQPLSRMRQPSAIVGQTRRHMPYLRLAGGGRTGAELLRQNQELLRESRHAKPSRRNSGAI
jgi:hypothetical protein